MSFVASWRAALRIARREARKARWRSALVIAMIALPVMFLAFAAVSYDMFTLNGTERADQSMGTATARVIWQSRVPAAQMPDPEQGSYSDMSLALGGNGNPTLDPGRPTQPTQVATPGGDVKVDPKTGQPAGPSDVDKPPTRADLVAALPAGSTVAPLRRGVVALKIPDGVAQIDAVSVDATTSLTDGYVRVIEGHAPVVTAEVALTRQAMARLGVGVGGSVTLGGGTHPFRVVGEVEFPSLLDQVALFAPLPDPTPDGMEFNRDSWLVRTPGPVTWSDVLRYNQLGMIVTSRAVLENPPPADQIVFVYADGGVNVEQVSYAVLIAGLALLEIILMAGPAFAISARRRQRQLALVAANGGTSAQVRRIVLADGVVLGLSGAVVGIALGIVAAFAARPLIEATLAHFRAGGYRVFPVAMLAIAGLALVTGVLAALVPAFIIARQNIISSLAGRRGVTRSRKRWLVLGVAMAALGTVVVVHGTSHVDTTQMLAGLIIGELGLVLCTPSLVGLISRVGRILPLGPRIALRDAARNRAAAAPAISAVMAAVAGSVAIGLYFVSNTEQQREVYDQRMPDRVRERHSGRRREAGATYRRSPGRSRPRCGRPCR